MNIKYSDTKEFNADELKELFLSVEWSSSAYPDKLKIAMKNSASVFSAWDDNNLAGLINAFDDGIMTAYVHYLLVNPKYHGKGIGKKLVELIKKKYKDYLRIVVVSYNDEIGFYEHCGFTKGDDASPMFITSLWT